MSSIAKMWRQFKSTLTSKWIFNDQAISKGLTPCQRYGIDDETWKQFVRSRTGPQWEVCYYLKTLVCFHIVLLI